jgi:peptidoglycan-N-acetylglucosamine deacetylase
VLLAVSVDLDEVGNYRAIHGLGPAQDCHLVYERAIARLRAWSGQQGFPLTWFVVGRDLERAPNAETIRALARGGDEMGCHSYHHRYDLTRRSPAEIRGDVRRGFAAVEQAAGRAPRGFRAPGYVVTSELLQVVAEEGFTYDSSVFPCPAYYGAKAAAIAVHAARGRRSSSLCDSPLVLRAPTRPYRVGASYWRPGSGLWEIPIQVTRCGRLPFIGTSLAVAGVTGARLLARGVAGEATVNLELHGIDALDVSDGLSELSRHQPDLRVPWRRKLQAIGEAIAWLRRRGYRCVKMADILGGDLRESAAPGHLVE